MSAHILVCHGTLLGIACLLFLFLVACESSAPISSANNQANGTIITAGVSPTAGAPTGGGGAGVVGGSGAPIAGAVVGGSPTTPGGGAAIGGMDGSSGSSAGGTGAGNLSGGPGGASGTDVGDNPLDLGNYFQSGSWQGYVWTAANGAGSSISPTDFDSQTTGMPRCVMGSVAAAADYSGTAVLGFNLSEGEGVTSNSVTPTKQGVLIEIDNRGGSPLRFQIKSVSGTEWCTPLSGSGGFIPWNSLKTECWGSTGSAYNNEPIVSAMVLVPGTNVAAVQYDFCVNSLAEGNPPPGWTPGGGTESTGTSGDTGGSDGTGGIDSTFSDDGVTVPPLQNGCDGYATRYWDCCKPHCGWSANASLGPLASCDVSDNSYGGNYDVGNACGFGGGSAYLCHSNAPWAVSGRLAYGFAAVAVRSSIAICGKCYQLDFTGSSHNAGGDPGSSALAGKSMIVQAINIGGDVGGGQFDIAIPGGGVGQFNACSTQWGVMPLQLGATYGGFLKTCKDQGMASDHGALKNCVMQKCSSVFEAAGLTELFDACKWFVEWFEVADNPSVKYAEVQCPIALMDRGMRRSGGGGGSCLP